MVGEPGASDAPTAGRVKQKERTRQALLAAARELLEAGETVTIALTAARAMVSEPTAYRYYSDVPSLLRDALAMYWPQLDELVAEILTMPRVAERARHAAEAMTRAVLAREKEIRALIALSYSQSGATKHRHGATSRPAFRVILIDAVMRGQSDERSTSSRRCLKLALSAIISAEAVLSLKDATECSDHELVTTIGWAAYKIALAS